MRSLHSAVMTLLLFLCTQAHVTQAADVTKVKTGILPSGEFYRLYEVQCADQSQASVASLNRGRKWCTNQQDQLSCFRRMEQASNLACAQQRQFVANDIAPALIGD